MKATELVPYAETLMEFLKGNEDLPPAGMIFSGDGFGETRPQIGVFVDVPDGNESKITTSGVIYDLPFQVHLIILPEARQYKRDALIDALDVADKAVKAIRFSHQFDQLKLNTVEPISIINNTASETIVTVNYEAAVQV